MKHIKHLLFIIIVLSLAIFACRTISRTEVVSRDDTAEEFVSREVPTEEVDYAEEVFKVLYGCFKSYVYDTENPDEFISANNTRIRLIDGGKRSVISMTLNDADKANGMLWKGYTGINIIYNSSGTWEEPPYKAIFWREYRYYEDGKVTTTLFPDIHTEVEVGAKCHPNYRDRQILYEN